MCTRDVNRCKILAAPGDPIDEFLRMLRGQGRIDKVSYRPLAATRSPSSPIQRGDSTTVRARLTEIRNLPDSLRRLRCSAARLIVQMALARGLHEAKAFEIQEMLRADS